MEDGKSRQQDGCKWVAKVVREAERDLSSPEAKPETQIPWHSIAVHPRRYGGMGRHIWKCIAVLKCPGWQGIERQCHQMPLQDYHDRLLRIKVSGSSYRILICGLRLWHATRCGWCSTVPEACDHRPTIILDVLIHVMFTIEPLPPSPRNTRQYRISMYIWPFRRPIVIAAATTPVVQSPQPPYRSSTDSSMEKEATSPKSTGNYNSPGMRSDTEYDEKRDYLPRPVAAPRTSSYRSRGLRPSRRGVAIALITMILLWTFQPLFAPLFRLARDRVNISVASKSGSTITLDIISSEKELVPLEAHIMSKCPDAQDCLIDLIVPAMQRVSDKVNFTLSFIGDIDPDEAVHCKHGEDECLGNMMMLCAAKLYPDPKISLGFSTCLIRDYEEIPGRTFVEGCALEHAVDFDKLNKCMSEEGEGLELLKDSIRRSAEKEVQYSCTVRLNDKLRCIRDGGEWVNCDDGSEPGDLIRDVDALYK